MTPRVSNKKLDWIKSIALAILLGLGAFMPLRSAFSLDWSLANSYRGGIYGGMIESWNRLVEILGNSDGLVMRKLAGGSGDCGLFLTLLLILLIGISLMIVKSGNRWLLLLYFLPVFLPSMLFNIQPSLFSVCISLIGMGLALIFMGGEGVLGLWNAGFVVGLVLLVLFLFQIPTLSSILEKPDPLVSFDKKIEKGLADLYYGSNPLKDGDLSIQKRTGGDETALEVKMSEPDSLYLRGFIGENYGEGGWQSLDYSAYYQNRDLAYWLNKKGFNGLGQIGSVENAFLKGEDSSGENDQVNEIDVEVKNANKKYAYIPYEISENALDDSVNWGNSYITSGKWGRMKSYSYTAYENAVNHWTDIAGQVFTKDRGEDYYAYMVKESHYNSFVYENYTFLEEGDKELLEEYIGSPGDQIKGHIGYKEAIEKVKGYFEENFIYTENMGQVDEDEDGGSPDMVASFLEGKKGYDVHFASAATLIFRYYGIPARYVEGYLVTPQDIQGKTSGDVIEIPRKNIHAWTEIYVDGVGFVPIETTLGYEGVMEEADLSRGLSNKSLNEKFKESPSVVKDKNEETRVKDGKNKINLIWILTIIILIILGLLLLYLLFLLARKVSRVLKRRKRFYNKDYKLGVAAIYDHMWKRDLDIGDQVRAIGNKAAYSKEGISKEERDLMLKKLKEMKREARNVHKRKTGR